MDNSFQLSEILIVLLVVIFLIGLFYVSIIIEKRIKQSLIVFIIKIFQTILLIYIISWLSTGLSALINPNISEDNFFPTYLGIGISILYILNFLIKRFTLINKRTANTSFANFKFYLLSNFSNSLAIPRYTVFALPFIQLLFGNRLVAGFIAQEIFLLIIMYFFFLWWVKR